MLSIQQGGHVDLSYFLQEFNPQSLSNVLWAFASLKHHPGDALLDASAAHAVRCVDQFTPQVRCLQVSLVILMLCPYVLSGDKSWQLSIQQTLLHQLHIITRSAQGLSHKSYIPWAVCGVHLHSPVITAPACLVHVKALCLCIYVTLCCLCC